jgi:UDP-2,4-diacetamido-2,4,6-trideoxy-beta-L-altropyranose hydrolase
VNVVFRTDSSVQIGTGHVMRCLTLAEALKERGADVSFLCRELPGNLCAFLERQEVRLHRLPFQESSGIKCKSDIAHAGYLGVDWERDSEEARIVLGRCAGIDWLIVDHYSLDSRWESRLRPFIKQVMVIDDIADRPHDCDLLLDQNLYQDMDTRYNHLVPGHCRKLLGPKYAVLRPEFRAARKKMPLRDGQTRRLLVFFGGSDIDNATEKALVAIRALGRPEILVDVVVGASNPNRQRIRDLCTAMGNVTFHCQVPNMADLILGADLAIGAAGTTTWERCCLGLPSLIVSLAGNQEKIAREADRNGIGVLVEHNVLNSPLKLKERIDEMIGSPDALIAQSGKCLRLVDGLGVERILEHLMPATQGIRPE